jgi:hypothetical protein
LAVVPSLNSDHPCQQNRSRSQCACTGKACCEETHSLRNPVLGAEAPKKKERNRTLAAKKMKWILRNNASQS